MSDEDCRPSPKEIAKTIEMSNYLQKSVQQYVNNNDVNLHVVWSSLLNVMVDVEVWACNDEDILFPSESFISMLQSAVNTLAIMRKEGLN